VARATKVRDAIVDAARRVFLRDGYAASIDTIIEEGGVARQSLYNHFRDKRSLFRAVIETVAAQTMTPLRNLALSPGEPLESALRRFGEAYMRGMLDPENLAMTRLIASSTKDYPAAGRHAYQVGPQRSIALLANYLRAQSLTGRIRRIAPRVVAESFYGALVGPARFRYLLGVNVPSSARQQRDYVSEIVSLYVAGLSTSNRPRKVRS
jgi:TetR/AcrR family transcriptional regulator, mexJK operon transcriptional repressor